MNRRLLPFFVAGAIILVAVTILHTLGVTGTGKRLEFQTFYQGNYAGVTVSTYYIVDNVDEWVNVWSFVQMHDPEMNLPEVDFSRTTIIAVFMGHSTLGYGIAVKEIIDTGLSVVVRVERMVPGKDCVVPLAITSPVHIVKVDKIDKTVIFDTITRTVECG